MYIVCFHFCAVNIGYGLQGFTTSPALLFVPTETNFDNKILFRQVSTKQQTFTITFQYALGDGLLLFNGAVTNLPANTASPSLSLMMGLSAGTVSNITYIYTSLENNVLTNTTYIFSVINEASAFANAAENFIFSSSGSIPELSCVCMFETEDPEFDGQKCLCSSRDISDWRFSSSGPISVTASNTHKLSSDTSVGARHKRWAEVRSAHLAATSSCVQIDEPELYYRGWKNK
jgi:hypothetical protein